MIEKQGVKFKWMVQNGMAFHEPILNWSAGNTANLVLTQFHSVEDAEKFKEGFDAHLKEGNEKDKWVLCQQSMMPLVDRFLVSNAEDLSKILAGFEDTIDPEIVRRKWNENRKEEAFIGEFVGFTSKGLNYASLTFGSPEWHIIPWDFLRFV